MAKTPGAQTRIDLAFRRLQLALQRGGYEFSVTELESAVTAASRVVEDRGAVAAVRAHREHWVKWNGDRAGMMRPADRELWIAVLGPDAGGRS